MDFNPGALKILKKKKNIRLINAKNFTIEDLVRFNSANEFYLNPI